MKRRVLTAAVLLIGLLCALVFLPAPAWSAAVAVVVAAGAWEWAGLAGLTPRARIVYALVAAGAMFLVDSASPAIAGVLRGLVFGAAAAFWIVFAPLWLWERPRFPAKLVPLASGLLVLAAAGVAMIDLRARGAWLLLSVLGLVWISDTAAYFVGRRFGRRLLAPTISPGKTWEGVGGALAAVAVYAICLRLLPGQPEIGWLERAPLGSMWFVVSMMGLAGAGIAGDLLESQLKRQAGVKDSSHLLPGHGGVLDRIDAMLPVLPLAALMFVR